MKTILILLFTFIPSAFAWQTDRIIDEPELEEYGQGLDYARLTFVDRNVVVKREGEVEDALINYPITYGDQIESATGAYTELEFIDGTLLQVDGNSRVEFQAISQILDDEALTVINMYEGAVLFHITDSQIDVGRRVFRVDTEAGSAYFDTPGVYFVEFRVRHMKLKVYRGMAELSGSEGSTLMRSGEYATILGMTRPSRVRSFNAFQGNRFERWAYGRAPRAANASSKYVDQNLRYYAADLDDSGDWRYESDINVHVWVPSVNTGWSPYHNGYWTSANRSLTWVSYDQFGWVTHHYGNWGWNLRWGWYWIPGRFYSPAWVAWNSYDNYVGWCPLGYWRTPFYYDRHYRHNTLIVNNYNHHWNYVNVREVHHRRVNIRRESRDHLNGRREITTRPIHVSRSDVQKPRAVQTAIRDVESNRRYASQRNEGTRVLRSTEGKENRQAVVTRDTGTRAVSRYDTQTSRTNSSTRTERTVNTRTSERAPSERQETTRTITPRGTSDPKQPRTVDTPSRNTRTTPEPRSTTRSPATPRSTDSTRSSTDRQPTRQATPPKTTAPPRTATPTPRTVEKPAPKPTTRKPVKRTAPPKTTTDTETTERDRDRAPSRLSQSNGREPRARVSSSSRQSRVKSQTTSKPRSTVQRSSSSRQASPPPRKAQTRTSRPQAQRPTRTTAPVKQRSSVKSKPSRTSKTKASTPTKSRKTSSKSTSKSRRNRQNSPDSE